MFPDFTILKKTTREEVYLEHFGMTAAKYKSVGWLFERITGYMSG